MAAYSAVVYLEGSRSPGMYRGPGTEYRSHISSHSNESTYGTRDCTKEMVYTPYWHVQQAMFIIAQASRDEMTSLSPAMSPGSRPLYKQFIIIKEKRRPTTRKTPVIVIIIITKVRERRRLFVCKVRY